LKTTLAWKGTTAETWASAEPLSQDAAKERPRDKKVGQEEKKKCLGNYIHIGGKGWTGKGTKEDLGDARRETRRGEKHPAKKRWRTCEGVTKGINYF